LPHEAHSHDGARRGGSARGAQAAQVRGAPEHHQGDRRGARARRSVRERRISRRARAAGIIEGRIKEIEGKLANAEIIDPSTLPNNGKVVFGAVVELASEADGARVTYQVVGEDEADIRAGRVSVTSPIARALVGKSEGEVVEVAAPGGTRSYEIVAVRLG
jgi:transcription elongation factor GreA